MADVIIKHIPSGRKKRVSQEDARKLLKSHPGEIELVKSGQAAQKAMEEGTTADASSIETGAAHALESATFGLPGPAIGMWQMTNDKERSQLLAEEDALRRALFAPGVDPGGSVTVHVRGEEPQIMPTEMAKMELEAVVGARKEVGQKLYETGKSDWDRYLGKSEQEDETAAGIGTVGGFLAPGAGVLKGGKAAIGAARGALGKAGIAAPGLAAGALGVAGSVAPGGMSRMAARAAKWLLERRAAKGAAGGVARSATTAAAKPAAAAAAKPAWAGAKTVPPKWAGAATGTQAVPAQAAKTMATSHALPTATAARTAAAGVPAAGRAAKTVAEPAARTAEELAAMTLPELRTIAEMAAKTAPEMAARTVPELAAKTIPEVAIKTMPEMAIKTMPRAKIEEAILKQIEKELLGL